MSKTSYSLLESQKSINDWLVYQITAFMRSIVATVILGILQKAKSNAKKEKLHVTLIAQNNVVLQAQVTQTRCILAGGNYLLKDNLEQRNKQMRVIGNSIHERSNHIESDLDETDVVLDKIEAYTRKK